MRVYLGQKIMFKLPNWFENKYKNTAIEDSSFEFIDSEELKALSRDVEFQQILFEASLKVVNSIDFLEILIKQNAHLIGVIENELNKKNNESTTMAINNCTACLQHAGFASLQICNVFLWASILPPVALNFPSDTKPAPSDNKHKASSYIGFLFHH